MNKLINPFNLIPGCVLTLKSKRVVDYDLASGKVEFIRAEERKGYKVPWIVGKSEKGRGYFKPSDFV